MNLNLLNLVFSLTLEGTVDSPFALFDLSRRFPPLFRDGTCGRSDRCGECPEAAGCPWFPLFGQQLSPDAEAVKRHQKPPLPFVFAPPFLAPGDATGDDAEIGLILVGTAINHSADFIRAMERYCSDAAAGGGLTLSLGAIASEGSYGERSVVARTKQGNAGNLSILAADDLAGRYMGHPDRITLDFVTPLRLFHEGRMLRTFDVSLFLRGVVRRVSALAAAYGDGEMDADFRWLSRQSREIRASLSGPGLVGADASAMAGIMGSVTLEGDLEPFLPFLALGEVLHAGKGASWGFGRYAIRRA